MKLILAYLSYINTESLSITLGFNYLKNDDHIGDSVTEDSFKSTDPIPPPRRQNNALSQRRRCRSKPGLISEDPLI